MLTNMVMAARTATRSCFILIAFKFVVLVFFLFLPFGFSASVPSWFAVLCRSLCKSTYRKA